MAKISVIVPAYNAETTLRTAVESILSQQVPGMEIIIVNDGSADGTARLCHCRHRIFGRGKIIKHLPPDKVQVNFPGFGLKVILTEYLLMEN